MGSEWAYSTILIIVKNHYYKSSSLWQKNNPSAAQHISLVDSPSALTSELDSIKGQYKVTVSSVIGTAYNDL